MVIHIEFDVIKLAFAKLTVSLGNNPHFFLQRFVRRIGVCVSYQGIEPLSLHSSNLYPESVRISSSTCVIYCSKKARNRSSNFFTDCNSPMDVPDMYE